MIIIFIVSFKCFYFFHFYIYFFTYFFSVPNSLEGQLKITNHEFINEYNDHNSPIYQRITTELMEGIKEVLSTTTDIVDEINVKILNLT